jgi:hypothetical protein
MRSRHQVLSHLQRNREISCDLIQESVFVAVKATGGGSFRLDRWDFFSVDVCLISIILGGMLYKSPDGG